MAASTHRIKRAVVAELERVNMATPKQIGAALGPEWQTPDKEAKLRQYIRQMTRGRILMNLSRGVYGLAPGYKRRGFDERDVTERAIDEFLREVGGVASTAEIHGALWGYMPGDDRHTYDHKRITVALKESPRFRQDFGRGYWNLTADAMDKLPLLGRWASARVEMEFDGPTEAFETWQEVREELFVTVAGAFADARNGLTFEQVVADPDIAVALRMMAEQSPGARALAYESWKAEEEENKGEITPENAYETAQAMRARKPVGIAMHMYALFEMGDVTVQLAAPLEMYTACAALFGVCPVALSRGRIVQREGSS